MTKEEDQKIVIYWSGKKTISLICAILLIPMLWIFLLSTTLKTTILNPDYYLKTLTKIDAYSRLIDEGIPSLILETKISDNQLTDTFAKEIAVFIIQRSIDPSWVENQTSTLVQKITGWLRDPNNNVSLDLTETKTIINKVSAGLVIFDGILPSCQTIGQSQALLGSAPNLKQNCQLKTDLAIVKTQVDKINFGVVTLDRYISNANSFIESLRHFSKNISFYFWFSLISMIILAAIIAILELNDISFVIKFVSLPLIISSFFAFFAGVISKSLIPTTYSGLGINLPTPIREIIADFTSNSVSGIFIQLEVVSAITFGIFIAIFITSLILKHKGYKLFNHKS